MILYTTTVLEISIGYYFIISKPTLFLSLKMRKNVPNNGQSVAEDMTSNARHFLPVHLVRLVRFDTWLYVWYVSVRFGTSACRVGFFDMKLSLEGIIRSCRFLYRVPYTNYFIATSTDPHILTLVFQINLYPEVEKIRGFDCADALGARRYRKMCSRCTYRTNDPHISKVLLR
jgi:hypothetical protein